MSLEDKFMPSDGSIINEFDNFMIRQMAKAGNFYQNATGDTYKSLAHSMLNASQKAAWCNMIANPLVGYVIADSIAGFKRHLKFETPIEEEIRYESRGQSKKTGKYIRTGRIGVGCIFLSTLLLDSEPTYFDTLYRAGIVGGVISYYTANLAHYLSKADLPKPKEKEAEEPLPVLVPLIDRMHPALG
jgi:hypothetical protein